MKKQILTYVIALISVSTFSQKTIENPEYGMSTFPGKITKIELLTDTTVLHFNIKMNVGRTFSIPSGSSLINPVSKEEFAVIKAEGVEINGSYTMPSSGEMSYKLFFPKIDSTVEFIDFGEVNEGGTWYIYGIAINPTKEISLLPKVLKGNWLKTDGSNSWAYGLYSKNAVINRKIWNYKSVDKKGKLHIITLRNNEEEKVIYVKPNKDKTVSIGETKKQLKRYSKEKTHNPNFKLPNDNPYKPEDIFKMDSATYSGILKGFVTRMKQKTGMAYVNNIFTSKQDSYLIKINEDGTFSTKFPLYYPQTIYVRMPSGSYSVFVEPGKETWQLINSSGEPNLFMGDCALTNTGLQIAENIRYFDYNDMSAKIPVMSPKDYIQYCLDIKNRELADLEVLVKREFLNVKAQQVKTKMINYNFYQNAISYEMNRESVSRRNKDVKLTDFGKIDASFFDIITFNALNDVNGVLTTNYYYFINRLKYSSVFRAKGVQPYSTAEIAMLLQTNGKELSDGELKMVEASKLVHTDDISKKLKKFTKDFGEAEINFYRKYYQIYRKVNKDKSKHIHMVIALAENLKTNGTELTDEEKKLLTAVRAIKTPDELENEKQFNNDYGEVVDEFHKKHKSFISGLMRKKYSDYRNNKIKAIFNINKGFALDVMTVQDKYSRLENEFKPFNNKELKQAQEEINLPFIAKYLEFENNKTKAKIETPKTEADKVFDAIISNYKDKVVFVDFWATWCAPCRSGIKKMKPLKAELKDKDIVFVYITNQTSPKTTWSNMIPDIKGEHYRVSEDEWNYLASKFNISGIPHYTLVNKEGVVVKNSIYFASGIDSFKKLFEEYLEK